MWKTLNFMVFRYRTQMATQHAACRLQANLHVSVARPGLGGNECSNIGSGFRKAFNGSGRV
jgi:hypothetical protein